MNAKRTEITICGETDQIIYTDRTIGFKGREHRRLNPQDMAELETTLECMKYRLMHGSEDYPAEKDNVPQIYKHLSTEYMLNTYLDDPLLPLKDWYKELRTERLESALDIAETRLKGLQQERRTYKFNRREKGFFDSAEKKELNKMSKKIESQTQVVRKLKKELAAESE